MIEKLPPELAGLILRPLDTASKASAEKVGRAWQPIVREHAWTGDDYQTFAPVRVCHDVTPRTSRGWHAAARERHQIERAMMPLLAAITPWTSAAVMGFARAYIERRDFKSALVLMNLRNFPAPSEEVWLQEMHRCLNGMRRPRAAHAVNRRLAAYAMVKATIDSDNPDRLSVFGPACRRSDFERMLRQAANGRNQCFARACELLASTGSRDRFGNPIDYAIEHRSTSILRTALANGFPITGRQINHAARFVGSAQLQAMVHGAGAAPENMLGAMSYVLTAPVVPFNRDDALRDLIAAGADTNAPLSSALLHGYEQQRPPFLACFTLHQNYIAPLLRRLIGANANVHAVVNGMNAWHYFAKSNIRDLAAVAQVLRSAEVPINALSHEPGGRLQGTPVFWGSCRFPESRVALLLGSGASLQGTHLINGRKRLNAMGAALFAKDNLLAALALAEHIEPPNDALERSAPWMRAVVFETLVGKRRWSQNALDKAFQKLLTTKGNQDNDGRSSGDRRVRMLTSVARAGAEVNCIAKPWRPNTHLAKRGKDVAPGLWPTPALMLAASSIGSAKAMPYMQALREMGGNFHARGPMGTNAWHALVTVNPPDAQEVAAFLLAEDVDVMAQAEGPNGPITPLDAVTAMEPECQLRFIVEDAMQAQWWKRQRTDG